MRKINAEIGELCRKHIFCMLELLKNSYFQKNPLLEGKKNMFFTQ